MTEPDEETLQRLRLEAALGGQPVSYAYAEGYAVRAHPNGARGWYRNDQRHRDDGPAVEWADGTLEWRRHGLLHREDGPAVERADGTLEWWRHGLLHREDGPAVERADGTLEWWRDGIQTDMLGAPLPVPTVQSIDHRQGVITMAPTFLDTVRVEEK